VKKKVRKPDLSPKETVKPAATDATATPKPEDAKPAPEPQWVSSYEALGALVGLRRESIQRLLKKHKGDPALAQLTRANCDHSVPVWRAFMAAHNIEARSADTPEGKAAKEERLLDEKIRKAAFENDVREGNYLLTAEVVAFLRDTHETLKRLDRQIYEEETPPLSAGKTAAAIRLVNQAANDRKAVLMREHAEKLKTLGKKP